MILETLTTYKFLKRKNTYVLSAPTWFLRLAVRKVTGVTVSLRTHCGEDRPVTSTRQVTGWEMTPEEAGLLLALSRDSLGCSQCEP